MESELVSPEKTRMSQSPSVGALVVAFVIGCSVALGVTYFLNFILDGQGSFANAGGGIIGTLVVVVAFRQLGKRRKGNG